MEFKKSQQQLNQAIAQREKSECDLFKEKEKLNKTRREKTKFSRFVAKGQGAADARLRELEYKEKQITGKIDKLSTALNNDQKIEIGSFESFFQFTDPIKNIAKLDDRYPLLLFPLRIETRFKKIEIAGADTKHQLWVRVYPDDIAIDTFEELLSENEVRNARSYWSNMWRAGDVEEDQRAAWRTLVSNHGSGRAHWIINNYRPVNQSEQPERKTKEKINLIIATDDLPEEEEREALKTFWSAMWLAQDDMAKQTAAWEQLVEQVTEVQALELQKKYVPANFSDKPPAPQTYQGVTPEVAFIIFPKPDDIDTKFQAWAKTPKVNILPERLVLLGFNENKEKPVLQVIGNTIPSSLATGPDPSAEEGEQMRIEDGDLIVSAEMKWMVDFEKAVAKGMGFRIDLTPDQAENGFDRLFVLGLRLSMDEERGKIALETLIDHHHHSRKGFAILSQGMPTNNTEKDNSTYSWKEDSDDSFDIYFKNETPQDPKGWFEKNDGRWLAEILGINTSVLENVANYYGTDQCEARAMNVALWPATLGYFMETMMSPVFSDQAINQTKLFFQRYVSGRGMIPAIRVGKQPYGILPTTPFSRMKWIRVDTPFTHNTYVNSLFTEKFSYLQDLYNVLQKIDCDWTELISEVSHVGKNGDAHQILLDVVGLHSSSLEHHNRHAQSFEQFYNSLNLKGLGGIFLAILLAGVYVQGGKDLLSEFGYTGQEDEDTPDILKKFFFGRSDPLKGPLIDDVPLSESDPIRVYAKKDDEKFNYIQWLIDAANDSHDSLRKQQGFIDNKPPNAILYLLMQHALDLGYLDASLRLHTSAGIFDKKQVFEAIQEPKFIHIQDAKTDKGSRWQHLYKPEPSITSHESMLVGDYIPKIVKDREETITLRDQLKAMEHLKHVPTARLERIFTEHLDTCSYRLDAWILGLVNTQLSLMRGIQDGRDDVSPTQGIYIGAYSWLDDVRPKKEKLTPAKIDKDLQKVFADPEHPLMNDITNGGYIHAPSINQAVTAAILRNGYLANATSSNPTSLSVNLSSERVRLALSIIEGMRNGQSLAALLGYQLERGMHDRYDVEVDEFIFDLRKVFPLSANRMSTTKVDELDNVQKIEARNVINGLLLIEQIIKTEEKTYPFGRSDLPTQISEKQKEAINKEVERILDINDAVADLTIAESVHQAAQGNYDRAAATANTYSKGAIPPIPDVIKTPRSGVVVTHRVGLQLESDINPSNLINKTPRSKAEPAINKWLSSILPALDDIVCVVEFYDHDTDKTRSETISMEALDLQPIDVLYMAQIDNEQAMTALDDMILMNVIENFAPRPDVKIEIKYIEPVEDEDKVTLFELASLLSSLRTLIQCSRPLTAGDVKLPAESKKADESDVYMNPQKITLVRDDLKSLNEDLGDFISSISQVVDWTVAKGKFENEDVVKKLLDNGILEYVENDPDRIRFGISIMDEGKLRNNLSRIEGIQTDPIVVIWRQILTKYNRILTEFDTYINDEASIFKEISKFGWPQAGFGFLLEWKRQHFELLRNKVEGLITHWNNKLSEFDSLIADYNALSGTATDEEKFSLLKKAELKISAAITVPLPATPDQYKDELNNKLNNKRSRFENKLNDLKSILLENTLSGLYTKIEVETGDITTYDLIGLDIAKEKKQIFIFAQDLHQGAKRLQKDLVKRLQKVADLLPGNDFDIDPNQHINELLESGKVLLSDEFRIVPEFGLTDVQANEWQNAYDNRENLLIYQNKTLNEDLPVDFWLYGISRVREKMHHLENITILVDALIDQELELQPIQLPYQQEDYWLALEYPEKKTDDTPFKIDEDKLLYTAYYTMEFDKTKRQCGLLIDEWTEVIPTEEETTGLAFHYDRPNSEPPQTLLLVTPSEFRRSWQWRDLVDTLHETLDMAKKRAIEPDHIDKTRYARFLPALVSAVTVYPITAALNLVLNNEFYKAGTNNE